MAQNDSLRKYANYIMESYPGSKPRDYELDTTGLSNTSFGKEIREKEFALKKTITFINHGSYGTVPRRLLDIQTRYLWEREEQPDLWFRFHAKHYVERSTHAVAEFIGADVSNVLLLSNTTSANMHKWLYTPRGSSFLWFDSKHESWINPSNTSWQLGLSLDKQFFDQGTCEHIPFICARHALEFYTAIGGLEKIVAYTSELAEKAKEIFVTELGLETLHIPESLEAPNMKLIKLPAFPKFPCSMERMWDLQNALFAEKNIFGIVFLFSGSFYVRLSFQVYNDLDDLQTVARVMKDFIDKNI